jgi:ABC-type nitrate/sulfonate/bicarbonate transport system substrate-binding protein
MLKPFIASILSAAAMAFSGGKPLRIAYPSGINGQLAKVIEKAGFAEKHGFAPTFTFFQYGPPMIEALAAGEVDVILTSFNPTASFLAKKPGGLVIIADVGSAKHAVVVPGDSPAKTLADLKGKSIAVSFNSDLHVDVVKAIKDLGLDPAKDYKLLNVPPQELAQTFDQKLAEAVDIRIPPLLALQKKSARIVAEWPWQLLVVASDAYLAGKNVPPDSLREVLKDGVHFIANHPDQAAAWWAEQVRSDPKVVIAAAGLNPLYRITKREALDLKPGKELQARAAQWAASLVEYGIRKEKVEYVFR